MKLLIFPEDSTEEQTKMFQNWGTVDRALVEFSKKSKPSTFKFVFGKEEGERLWLHYVVDCDRDFWKFRTYLVLPQFNSLVINATLNEQIYAL